MREIRDIGRKKWFFLTENTRIVSFSLFSVSHSHSHSRLLQTLALLLFYDYGSFFPLNLHIAPLVSLNPRHILFQSCTHLPFNLTTPSYRKESSFHTLCSWTHLAGPLLLDEKHQWSWFYWLPQPRKFLCSSFYGWHGKPAPYSLLSDEKQNARQNFNSSWALGTLVCPFYSHFISCLFLVPMFFPFCCSFFFFFFWG